MSRLTSWLRPTTIAHAHCDVPCGIYDPAEAVLAARTVARMVELIGQIPEGSSAVADRNKFIGETASTSTRAPTLTGESPMLEWESPERE